MARAKAKVQETLNLDAILFKCRNILRKARNAGTVFDQRDLILTLVFLHFIGEKFEDGIENLRNSLIKEGLNPDDPDIRAAFLMTSPLWTAPIIFPKKPDGRPLLIRPLQN